MGPTLASAMGSDDKGMGAVVPVVDLSALSFGQAAAQRTSTRLVLVNYQPQPWVEPRRLGLILEQATDTLRCDLGEFKPYGLDNRETLIWDQPTRMENDPRGDERRFFARMLCDLVSGDRRRCPLFDPKTLEPIATPRRLTAEERQALRGSHRTD